MRRTSLLFITALLAACNTQTQPVDTKVEQEISWEEKQIAEIVKYEGFQEKNLKLSMEEQIKKQTTCKEYGREKYGDSEFGENFSSVVDFKYSFRFDRCFLKDNWTDNGGSGVNPLSRMMIIDVLSENTLFLYNRDCAAIYDKSRYTEEEYHDRCPYEFEVNMLWRALIQKLES